MPLLSLSRSAPISTRSRLIALAGAVVLPILVFASVLLWTFSTAERDRFRAVAEQSAAQLEAIIDRELIGFIAALEALAAAGTATATTTGAPGDWSSLDATARALLRTRGSFVAMRDRSGQQLFNTAAPPGTPLPVSTDPGLLAADRAVFETARPVVSDLYTGQVSGLKFVLIDAPVFRDGAVAFALSIALDPARLSELLAQNTTPAWTASIIEGQNRILARSRQHERFVGSLATADSIEATGGQHGTWNGRTLEGIEVLGGYVRSPLSGWRIAVGVPASIVEAPLVRLKLILVGSTLLVVVLSMALAARIAHTISEPIGRLSLAATNLGRGQKVPELTTGLREVDEVARALTGAEADIEQRKAALAESQARLRAVFQAVPVGVVIAEAPSGRIIDGNSHAERILGHPILPSVSIEGYDAWVGFHADGHRVKGMEYPLARVILGTEERPELEVHYQRADKRRVWVRIIGAPVRDQAGTLIGGVVAVVDIDREKRVEAELRELNATLERRVQETAADRDRIWRISTELMLVARFDGEIVAVNPAWEVTLGWAERELIGKHVVDLLHPEDVQRTLAEESNLSDGRTTRAFENRWRHRDGSYRWLSWTAVPEAGLTHAIARDVTAEKQAADALRRTEDQLRQSQKMEVVGQLTGGVAHDFNNLLTVVTGHLELARRRIESDGANPRLSRNIDSALEGARRAAILTHRLLAFARQSPLQPEVIDLNKIVSGMSDLIRRTLGENIAIETVLAGGLWRTEADPNAVESAVLNLCVNARDAMPDGGKLTIETTNAFLDETYPAAAEGEVRPGQFVMLAVCDTGAGMPAEVLEHVFEPFFTTKPVGKGTGLGLSQVFGFMRQSSGHVAIYSEPGEGTTVKLYFRRHSRPEQSKAADAPPAQTHVGAGRGETILVVEDEIMVREFTVSALEEAGYRVLEAPDGPEGLALLDAHPDISLLFTDVVLAGPLNGRKVADEALRRRPELKVLYTTGYARNAIVHHGRLDEGVEVITKPFTATALTAKIGRILNA